MTNSSSAPHRPPVMLPALVRVAVLVAGSTLFVFAMVAVMRALLGLAPSPAAAREVAVLVHLSAVLPAVPLGGYVLLSRKGDARHRALGKTWLVLMLVTAASAIFIRHLNGGEFSWIHLFVPLTFIGAYRAIVAARRHDIARHRRAVIILYLGALLIPGLFSFLPGRIMGLWLFG